MTVEVVVTGLGATTPLGGDVASTWEALLAGRSGVAPLDHDWAEQLPVRIAAELAQSAAGEDRPGQGPPARPVRAGRAGRGLGGVAAGRRAGRAQGPARRRGRQRHRRRADPAGPGRHPGGQRAAPGVAAHRPDADAQRPGGLRRAWNSARRPGSTRRPARAPPAPRPSPGGWTSSGPAGPTWSSPAAPRPIIHPLPIAGFAAMRAMSTRNDEPEKASRPWDKGRDGFVLGEGAGVVVLERADVARARGAQVFARLAGAGMTSDGYDIVQPHPRGCRRDPGDRRGDHATPASTSATSCTSTRTPPRRRSATWPRSRRCTRPLGDHPVLTSTKSMTGHLLGAAGAVEAIATILARVPRRRPADDQPRRPRRRARPRRRRAQGPPPRHPGRPEQLVRLRRPQRRADLHRA